MIGQLIGKLIEKQPPHLLLDVNGVGYEIEAPMSTFARLPDISQVITLLTHLVVREDAHQLFGFYTTEEKTLFRTLLKVNGVGPKLALTILSNIAVDEFVRAIHQQNSESLTKISGVGKKTAERLIIEMRDKLSNWQTLHADTPFSQATSLDSRHRILQDAISALVALGYKSPEASRAIGKIDDGCLSSEELIRHALREKMV